MDTRFSKTIADKLRWPSRGLFAQNPIWPPPIKVNGILRPLFALEPCVIPLFQCFRGQGFYLCGQYNTAIRGSGMTCHSIRPVTAPCSVTRSSGSWHWIRQVAAPCNVAGDSGMTCHWIGPNVRHIGILHLVSISTASPQSTCHSAPVSKILSKSDHPRQKIMTSCRFSRWRISAILDFRDPIMASLKSPCTTSWRSSIDTVVPNCLVFGKIAFFSILAIDRQTNWWTATMH